MLHIEKCVKTHLQRCRISKIFPDDTSMAGEGKKGSEGIGKGKENRDCQPTSFGL